MGIIGLTYDLRDDYLGLGFSEEAVAEFDSARTVDAIAETLESLGHRTERIGMAQRLVEQLAAGRRWDMVFNIAEGVAGFGRESLVPALLDAYGIPYTFSDPLTLAVTLHKGMAKQIVRDLGLPTPDFAVITREADLDGLSLPYPLFAKPVAEGTGKGVTARSRVHDPDTLRERVKNLLAAYSQPVLVETFLPGREFTVGIWGTGREAEGHCGDGSGIAGIGRRRGVHVPEQGTVGGPGGVQTGRRRSGPARGGSGRGRVARPGLPGRGPRRPALRRRGRAQFPGDQSPGRASPRALGPAHPVRAQGRRIQGPDRARHGFGRGAGQRAPGGRRTMRPRNHDGSMQVVVLHDDVADDAPPDQQDGLIQALEIGRTLEGLGHRVRRFPVAVPEQNVPDALKALGPDLLFNLCETPWGNSRSIARIPAVLDGLGLPYCGAGPGAMHGTSNKLLAKETLVRAGLPTTPWWQTRDELPAGDYVPGTPVILKSVWEHGSFGLEADSVITADDGGEIRAALDRRAETLGGEWFAESYVDGREFNLGLLGDGRGHVALPPAEILFPELPAEAVRVVGYKAKWLPDSAEYHNTPRRFAFPREDAALLATLGRMARACWDAFDLRGWARVDFRVDRQGRPFILEVNANPCLSSDAGFMAAADRAGLNPAGVVGRILEDARRPRRACAVAAQAV